MKKIFVTGNVGKDPESRADQNGTQFVTFSLAISVGKDKTDWVEISCNNKLADIARNYIKKGSKILVDGFPSVGAYINKEGKAVGSLRVFANNIEFIGAAPEKDTETPANYATPAHIADNKPGLVGDDIPFNVVG